MTTLPANYIDVQQQSPEWFQMREGMLTGSVTDDATCKMKRQPKEGPVAYYEARHNLMVDIALTRVTGIMPEHYVSRAMEQGIEREPMAVAAYEMARDVMTDSIGFVFHPEIKWFGTSPDFLLGSDIVGEVKCPTAATHLRYLIEADDARSKGLDYVPEEYLPQVKAHLSCTGRPLLHFVSFNPDFPKHQQLLITEWRRDKGMIEEQDREVVKFLAETDALVERIKAL